MTEQTRSLRTRLRAPEYLLGTLVSLPSPELTELLSLLKFDWLFIDAEHGPLDVLTVQRLLQGTANRCPCLVRIPVNEEAWIKKVLDCGAAGIIVPRVSTADEAQRAVQLAKYPPQGMRGIGLARAHGYGLRFESYLREANDHICVVVQAETQQAVTNIRDITAVPGVDAVFIGPYDLSASLGYPGEVAHPKVVTAIDSIIAACKNAGKIIGFFGTKIEAIAQARQKGCTLIAVGVDALLVVEKAQQIIDDFKKLS